MTPPPMYPNRRSAILAEAAQLVYFFLIGAAKLFSTINTWVMLAAGLLYLTAFVLTGVILTELWDDLSSRRAAAYNYLRDWVWVVLFSSYCVSDSLNHHTFASMIDLAVVIWSLYDIFGPKGRGRGKHASAYWGEKSQALLDKLATNPT